MKLFKKLASFILAFAMVMAIAMPSVVMADGDGSITITGANPNHTFEAYQIFAGEVSGKTLSNLKWGNGVNEDGRNKLGSAKENAEKLKNETDTKDFAYKVAKYLGTPAGESTRYGENYKIENLAPGYYLVKDKDDTVPEAEAYTKFILKVVGAAEVNVKSEVPTSQKKVKDTNDTTGATTDWQDSADWDIGDEVPFKIEGTLPSNYEKYTKYTLKFHDKQQAGLTFKHDSVKVFIDDTEITEGFEVVENPDDGDTFDVVFENLKNTSATNGSKVRVEYKSVLNGNANLGKPGNENTMYMEFSNNPNSEQGGEIGKTPEDTVIVFTYKVSVNKVNENNEKLDGADFTLEKKVKKNTNSDEYEWKPITKVTGTADDVFEFNGIDDGEYRLTETRAPANYDMLSEPIYFTVTAGHVDGADPFLETFSGNITSGNVGEMAFTANKENGILSTTIQNKPGSSLPETGGMGTTILYAAGTLMILAAAAFLVMKKKADSK